MCMKDPKTRSREITSLLCAMKELDLGTGKIIILDEEKILKEGDKTVKAMFDARIRYCRQSTAIVPF